MTYTSRFSSLAQSDLAAAYAWNLKYGTPAADKFADQIEAAILAIQEAPTLWAIWRLSDYRRYLIPKTPYMFVYRVESHLVSILSLLHQQQDASRRFPEDP
jgi:plasmid stabilization system protein ParE